VVDEYEGELVAAVDLSEEAQEAGDVGRAVFILCDQARYVTWRQKSLRNQETGRSLVT
jgi:hypothetical protein